MWFLFSILVLMFWGTADLFYKKGADEEEKYSHLLTAATVGTVMGAHALYVLIFQDIGYDFRNLLIYAPVSACYILSMAVGYYGLRYLELSISSPIQNSSGALVCLMCIVILKMQVDALSACGIVLICAGIFALGVIERRKQKKYETLNDRKYKIGFIAFLMPVAYCVIDSLGTFFDAYYLDDIASTPLVNVTEETFENVANTSYELTFFVCAVIILLYLTLIKKQKIIIKKQKNRAAAAVFETAGQFFYVYAMSGNGAVAAPMIASYSFVSILLSRLFLKEKLSKAQYAMIFAVMAGIVLLGVSEGMTE